MHNELLKIGDLTIYGYGTMIALGVLFACFFLEQRAKKVNLSMKTLYKLIAWAFIGGFLGAKLLYYITIAQDILAHPQLLLDFSNGFVVYGGILGGLLAGYLYCKSHAEQFFRYADIMLPCVALAQAFGRIGCFLAGCCYGATTSTGFCVVFTNSLFAPNGVALLPIQLVSSGLNFLNFIFLTIIFRHSKKQGVVSCCYLVFYSLGRFVLEFFRGDMVRGTVGIISTSQFISLFVFVFSIMWGWKLFCTHSKNFY